MGLEIGRPLSRLKIGLLNFKEDRTFLIFGLSLFRMSITKGKKRIFKNIRSTIKNCNFI